VSAPQAKKQSTKQWHLAGTSWVNTWKMFAGVGAIGLAGAAFGYTQDPKRFAFSWLFAFITVLTVSLGALFFVIIQRLTSAGWSVTVRRTAEFFAVGVVALVPLFIPVLGTMNHLFPWLGHHGAEPSHEAPAHVGSLEIDWVAPAHAEGKAAEPNAGANPAARGGVVHVAPDDSMPPDGPPHLTGRGGAGVRPPLGAPNGPHGAPGAPGAPGARAGRAPRVDPHELTEKKMLEKKSPYLNRTFFLIRVFLYFGVWMFLATRLFGFSTEQDRTKDPKLTLKAQAFAPIATFLYGITLTFAAFDWMMSLDPMWFSTIFGVVIFAAGVVSSLAAIILTTLALRSSGPLAGAVTIEHYHDLGKLMFGFLSFWAYVQFSQFMLIWYAALPEETTFFHARWDAEPWKNVSLMLVGVHFILPFLWTMSRNFKRNLLRLRIGAVTILSMHVVDIYWFVMPNLQHGQHGGAGFAFHWLDAACLLAVAGVYGAYVFHQMTRHALVPVGDPRLERSLQFMNA
jgi:hypothetical protein